MNLLSSTGAAGGQRADPPADVLDVGVFQELRDSLEQLEVVASVYRMFLSNAVTLIGALPEQANAARMNTLHTLKGSASLLGAHRMAKLAARLLEASLHSGAVEAGAEELQGELAMFRSAVVTHLDSLGYPLER